MSETASETNQDAITGEDISGTAAAPALPQVKKRNAFAVLMSPDTKKPKATEAVSPTTAVFYGRDGLAAYTNNPAGFPVSRIIYYNDDFVAVNDLFPKSSVHTLLLFRSSSKNVLHPFDAFEDAEFLEKVQKEIQNLRTLVAKELRRKYSKFSVREQARERILNGLDELSDGEDLPAGRDWEQDVMVGIHARPSMNHLHVHVLSVDRFSDCVKHRKHYNSFATPFFVEIEAFPLSEDDPRRHPGQEGYLDRDLKCWRCGKNYGRSFSKLKAHLKEEFENWKAA